MKLLFNHLMQSMRESDSVVKSKSSPSKSYGSPSKATKGNGNSKVDKIKTKPSTSGAEIKLNKFFESFKANRGLVENGGSDSPVSNRKQCNSQTNGTPTKRSKSSSPKNSSNSGKSSPLKSPTQMRCKKNTSLSSSASASAKKRAIERALKKKDPTTATNARRRLNLEELKLKNNKKKRKLILSPELPGFVHDDDAGNDERITISRHADSRSTSSKPKKRGRKRIDSNTSDESGKPRPRRRASQTYFFKYQLARNPLKAEEEDLKQALLASLEQCGQQKSTSSKKQQQLLNDLLLQDQSSNASTTSKTTKHNQRENHHQKQPRKQHPKHPPNTGKQSHSKTSSLSIAQNMVPVTPAIVATSTPPTYDEAYLEKYRPDTEDFLAFICFRINSSNFLSHKHPSLVDSKSAPNTANSILPINGCANNSNSSSITGSLNIKIEPNNNTISSNKQATSSSTTSSIVHDHNHLNLRRSVSPCKLNGNNSASSAGSNQLNSPSSNRRRPPTRQSPRLANNNMQLNQQQTHLQQKISDSASENGIYRAHQNLNTALNPMMDYEEDLKRASIALEDMAQEITKWNGVDPSNSVPSRTTRQQNGKSSQSQQLLLSTAESIERFPHKDQHTGNNNTQASANATTLPFKNNKHLVKGLMTREFAGTFADEEIIFESISNHKL